MVDDARHDAPPPPRRPSTSAAHASSAHRLLARAVDVKPDEVRGVLWSFFYFFFLLASYYVLRPLRDEMAIAGGVNKLQWLFTATLGVMLVAVPVWSALAARLPPRRLIAVVYRFFLANLVVFFLIFHRSGGEHAPTARAFFVWTSVFNLFVVSVFWSFMADVFRPGQSKRLFGFVAAGGSAGAIVGPLLTSLIVDRIGPINLLLIAAAFLEAAAQCAGRLAAWSSRRNAALAAAGEFDRAPDGSAERASAARPPTDRQAADDDRRASQSPARPAAPSPSPSPAALAPAAEALLPGEVTATPVGGGAWAALRLLFTSSYLGAIGAYVLLMTVTATFGYMLQARLVAAEGLTPAGRTGLFARIDLIVNIASAATQALLAGRLMARHGLAPALTLSPLLAILASLGLAAFPRLGVLIAATIARRVVEYSIASPARQVLFTVVTREEKYKPKALIDTVVFRGGDVVGSWAFTVIARQGASVPVLALCGIPLAVLWVGVAAWLARRHERTAARAPI